MRALSLGSPSGKLLPVLFSACLTFCSWEAVILIFPTEKSTFFSKTENFPWNISTWPALHFLPEDHSDEKFLTSSSCGVYL